MDLDAGGQASICVQSCLCDLIEAALEADGVVGSSGMTTEGCCHVGHAGRREDQAIGNMGLKILDFNLRQNINSNTTAISSRKENQQSKTSRNILMLNSITLTDQRSVLVKRRCSTDCSSLEHSRTVSSGRAAALPRNLIAVPRAGFTTATTWR